MITSIVPAADGACNSAYGQPCIGIACGGGPLRDPSISFMVFDSEPLYACPGCAYRTAVVFQRLGDMLRSEFFHRLAEMLRAEALMLMHGPGLTEVLESWSLPKPRRARRRTTE